MRTIEHGNLIDGANARLTPERDVFLVPTLVAHDAFERRDPDLGLQPVAGATLNREGSPSGRTIEAGETFSRCQLDPPGAAGRPMRFRQ